jgi:all-trans-8'-apo-beta-carotenal 15,15'-oxygenase
MTGRASIAECLQFNASLGVKVHLIPRPGRGTAPSGPEAARVFQLREAPFFSFHHVNAFELGGKVVVDTCAADFIDFAMSTDTASIAGYKDARKNDRLARVVVDTASGAVSCTRLSNRNADLPAINPAFNGVPYEHAYLYASPVSHPSVYGPPGCIWKTTMPSTAGVNGAPAAIAAEDLWSPGPGRIAQEPAFIPRPGGTAEDDGWIAAMVLDTTTSRSELAILDARNIGAGPIATLKLRSFVPLGLHGSWTPDDTAPAPDAGERSYDIRRGV